MLCARAAAHVAQDAWPELSLNRIPTEGSQHPQVAQGTLFPTSEMRQDSTQAEGSVALASGSTAGSTAQPDSTVLLPKIAPLGARLNVARPRITFGPTAARVALGAL